MSAPQQAATLTTWDLIMIIAVIIAIYKAIVVTCRSIARHHRESGEIRHQRRVELALARTGQFPRLLPRTTAGPENGSDPPGTWIVPSAVIASPPGARPARGVPGPCRHEEIVPVISQYGKVLRWLCANHDRCEAVFPADTSLYEETP